MNRIEQNKPLHTAKAAAAENAEPASGELADPRVTAMLPRELLQGGEIVILLIKPSPWYILLDSLGFFATIIAAVAMVFIFNHFGLAVKTLAFTDVILVAVILCVLRLAWQFLEWLSRVYVLTDRRIIRVKGVLRINVFETSFKRIQHTNTSFSLRERFFALGTISFATAGTNTIEASWQMIAKPLEVHKIVVQTLNRYR